MPIACGFKTCRECSKSLDLIHFSPRPGAKDGYRNDCKQCVRDRAAKWSAENPERVKETKKKCYIENKEHYLAYQKQYRKDNPLKVKMMDAQKHANRPKKNKSKPSWALDFNPKKSLAWVNLYRLKDGQLFCKQFIQETKEIYANCPKNFHVDHIIPINNEFVSGLHVPWNLQYLTFEENLSKRNKFDGTYSNESWKLQCQ